MKIISRKEALARGLKRYFTGKPCKHGHVTERIALYGNCRDCLNLRARQLRSKNPEKFRERVRAAYAKHSGKAKKQKRELYYKQLAEDPEKFRKRQQRYSKSFLERHGSAIVNAKKRNARAKNIEKYRENSRKYYAENREKIRERQRGYYAEKHQKYLERQRKSRAENREKHRAWHRKHNAKVSDLIAVLKAEQPELLKEFGL